MSQFNLNLYFIYKLGQPIALISKLLNIFKNLTILPLKKQFHKQGRNQSSRSNTSTANRHLKKEEKPFENLLHS